MTLAKDKLKYLFVVLTYVFKWLVLINDTYIAVVSRYTYSQTTTSSKQTTVRIETDGIGEDTSEDEDTDDALMMTAISEVEAARNRNRMRTVSTVSEGSELHTDEFSTAHTTDEVTSFEDSLKKANNLRHQTAVSTVSECSEFSTCQW